LEIEPTQFDIWVYNFCNGTQDGNFMSLPHIKIFDFQISLPKQQNICYIHSFPQASDTIKSSTFNFITKMKKQHSSYGYGSNQFPNDMANANESKSVLQLPTKNGLTFGQYPK